VTLVAIGRSGRDHDYGSIYAWFTVLLYHIILKWAARFKIHGRIVPVCVLIIVMVYKIYS
jgi:hypothetical protein